MPPSHPLRIAPKELVFPAPLNRVITNILKLQNVTQFPIAYKVKTTAPQRYCVRPNNGVLPPGETIEVQVLLNYVKDAPPNLDIKDKFQIQSIVLTGSLVNADIGEVWAKATNEQVIKQKLKSRFTAAIAPKTTVTPANPNTVSNPPTLQDTPHENIQTTTSTTITPQGETTFTTTSSIISHPAGQSPSPQVQQSNPSPQSSQFQLHSQHSQPSQSQYQSQSSIYELKASKESSDHLYSTPTISSISPVDVQPKISLDKSSDLGSSSPLIQSTPEAPKSTDTLVDTVANFTKLRQSLEQVAQLKSEKESVTKDNQKLHDQMKSLIDQLQRAKEEQQSGLRHRVAHTTPGSPLGRTSNDIQSIQSIQSPPMLIQIQTKVLLFIILFFCVFGFLLGRLTR